MAKKKADADPGIAVSVKELPASREAGIPVAVPRDDSTQEPKSGQTATTKKEG